MKFNRSGTFFTGVLASLIAAIVILLLSTIWTTFLNPAFQDWGYDGIKVEGTWLVHHDIITMDGDSLTVQNRKVEVKLSRTASDLSGTAESFTLTENSIRKDLNAFDVKGYVKNGYVTLLLNSSDGKMVNSVFSLKCTSFKRMEGIKTFYGRIAAEILAVRSEFERVK